MKYIFLFALIFTISCAVVPLTGRKQFTAIPESQMISLSADSYSQVLKDTPLSTNQVYQNQVKSVGRRLTAAVEKYLKENGLESRLEGFDWQYNVLKSDELNAWCMPGGQIAFYEGIMPVCQDENGIAVVMGHEIAHAIAQHGNERMSQQLMVQMGGVALSTALQTQKEETQNLALLAFGVGSKVGLELPFSRTHESEADELGLYFMSMAGYDPRTAPVFWERMQASGGSRPPEFLSTHPDPSNRIKDINRHMDKALGYYNSSK
ncbi:MAG: M48 family metallopeptidase [Bacteroidales bacterium]|nr:M48 family metallopeptidase [Bacteroidales bacterium]